MNANLHTKTCDPRRIESFLSGALGDVQEREFMQHLNACEDCRRALEHQAAEPKTWREAEELLRSSPFEMHSAGNDSDAGLKSSQPTQIRNVVDALGPTDNPEMLGRLGGYEVSGVVGAGGMGVVLKAIDQSLDRTVAIKVLAPHLASNGAARKRFAREAKAAAAVLHPNVIAIHSVSSNETPLPYLVMPYIRGTSLQKRLDAEGALSLQEVLRIGAQVAAGLAAAHAQGLVHRDIKPANILLEEGIERVTITDFGLARTADDATITHHGVIAGTPQFMSPEQARGEAVDVRSDLFSLGSVLYAICTGRPPFRAETSYGVMRRITDNDPKPIREINPDVPQWLCQLIGKLMSKQAADRYQSAAVVAEMLEACLAHVQQPTIAQLPPALQPSAGKSRFFSFSRRRSGWIAMIAAFGLGLLGLFAWQATEPPDIAGNWSGEEWGQVVLKKIADDEYSATYSDTLKERTGTIEVKWSRRELRYKGNWREGKDRSGKISLRLVDNEIRGAWTTSKKSKLQVRMPELSDLTWKRSRTESASTPEAMAAAEVQVRIASPAEMEVYVADQRGQFGKSPRLVAPVRLNLHSNKTYRLKLGNIAGREGAEFYPTLETGPTTPRTEAFLNHNAIPVEFTEEDFDQALAGNFVTKVIYLPDPEARDLAAGGVETVVSTRLDPGVDPIAEADRRGSILAVVRLGNKDVESQLAAPARDDESALPKGLRFLAPYKQLHRLSLDMTEKEFLAIVETQKLNIRKHAKDGKTTYSIPTGDGHTVIVMFSEDSETCRGIQRLRAETKLPESTSGAIQFSEPKELVLSMNSSKFMLDLDTGATMDPPATIRPEQAKMDVHPNQVQPYHFPTALIGLELTGMEMKESDWHASAIAVREALEGKGVEPLKEMDQGPEKHPTYFFKTRDGTCGVLQLLEVVDKPKGIRLRYKTIEAKPAAEQRGEVLTPNQIVERGQKLYHGRQPIVVRMKVAANKPLTVVDEKGSQHQYWTLLDADTPEFSIVVTNDGQKALLKGSATRFPDLYVGQWIEVEGTVQAVGLDVVSRPNTTWTYHVELNSLDQISFRERLTI